MLLLSRVVLVLGVLDCCVVLVSIDSLVSVCGVLRLLYSVVLMFDGIGRVLFGSEMLARLCSM